MHHINTNNLIHTKGAKINSLWLYNSMAIIVYQASTST